MSLRIVEGYGGYLVEWLQRSEIDATVLYGPASDLHFRVTELLFERLVLVGPAECDLNIDEPVPFRSVCRSSACIAKSAARIEDRRRSPPPQKAKPRSIYALKPTPFWS